MLIRASRGMAPLLAVLLLPSATRAAPQSQAVAPTRPVVPGQDPAALFAQGAQRLQSGDLAGAEAAFQAVAHMDPSSAAAYSNLGVIAMRQKRWAEALKQFHKAQQLDPAMIGVRLNTGLTYYRMNDFPAAAPEFAAVLASEPASGPGAVSSWAVPVLRRSLCRRA